MYKNITNADIINKAIYYKNDEQIELYILKIVLFIKLEMIMV